MTNRELIERVEAVATFDAPEVADKIEALSADDVEELNHNDDFAVKLVEDVQALQRALNNAFIDREELIEIALACFIAHLPMVTLGPPGTGKSDIFRALGEGLGLQKQPVGTDELEAEINRVVKAPRSGDSWVSGMNGSRPYFEYCLTSSTTPEELLGPADPELIKHHALLYRQTDGWLPRATVAFLDEIFQMNSAVLNALASITSERLLYNAGRPVRVPLCMLYGASSQPPAERKLGALYDRFPVRVLCRPVEDTFTKLRRLLEKSTGQAHDQLLRGPLAGTRIRQVATVNHFRMLHRLIHVSYGGRGVGRHDDPFLQAYCATYKTLKREFEISDRSFGRLYRLARALACLRNHSRLMPSELQVYRYCFPDPETAAPLADAVDEHIRRCGHLVGAAA
jgi:MoxR-like ATPase